MKWNCAILDTNHIKTNIYFESLSRRRRKWKRNEKNEEEKLIICQDKNKKKGTHKTKTRFRCVKHTNSHCALYFQEERKTTANQTKQEEEKKMTKNWKDTVCKFHGWLKQYEKKSIQNKKKNKKISFFGRNRENEY